MAEEAKKSENQPEQAETPTEKTYSKAEYDALKQQLQDANKTIQSFQSMDIESIKKSADEWKQKAEQAEHDRKAFEHDTKLKAYVKSLNLRDDVYEQHVMQMLKEKDLKFEGDKLIGGEDIVQAFRKAHETAFLPDRKEQVAGATSGKAPEALDGVSKAFYEKNPGLVPKY